MSSFVHSYYIIYDIIVNIFYQSIIFFLSRWVNKANITELERYPLALNESLSAYRSSYITKNDFGQINVVINVSCPTSVKLSNGTQILTFPEGFIPSGNSEFPGFTGLSTSSTRVPCGLYVYDAKLILATDAISHLFLVSQFTASVD